MTTSSFVFGIHSVKALLNAQPHQIEKIYVLQKREDERLESMLQQAKGAGISVERVTQQDLDHLLGQQRVHQGVIAQCKSFSGFDEAALKDLVQGRTTPILLLILDGVQDPHNLGACLRSANAFGVQAVIAPKDRAVGLTPVARKAASGAAEITPFIPVTNLVRTLRWLKENGVWIVGMEADAPTPIRDIDLTGNIAIVLGGEGSGMRRLTKEHCDFLASIPMEGAVESINVSVSTGICLYEIQRQRLLE